MNTQEFGNLYCWFFGNLHVDGVTLDLDLTVMILMGSRKARSEATNACKHGCYSDYPLMTFVADIRMVANLWLRPGNSHNTNNALAFLDDSLDKLAGKRVGG